jgi:hypothetical protein
LPVSVAGWSADIAETQMPARGRRIAAARSRPTPTKHAQVSGRVTRPRRAIDADPAGAARWIRTPRPSATIASSRERVASREPPRRLRCQTQRLQHTGSWPSGHSCCFGTTPRSGGWAFVPECPGAHQRPGSAMRKRSRSVIAIPFGPAAIRSWSRVPVRHARWWRGNRGTRSGPGCR